MDETESPLNEVPLNEAINAVKRLYSWAANRMDEYFTMPGYSATQRLMEAYDALVRAQAELERDRENDEARARHVAECGEVTARREQRR